MSTEQMPQSQNKCQTNGVIRTNLVSAKK